MKILVIDDSERSRKLISLYLNNENHELTFASDGMEALELARENDFNFVLMDLHMPNLDGLTTYSKFKEIGLGSNSHFVAMSSFLSEEEKQNAIDHGFQSILEKPLGKKKLIGLLYENQSEGPDIIHVDARLRPAMPLFFSETKNDLLKMRKALLENQFKEIKKIAHIFKGDMGGYGFHRLGEIAQRLEEAAGGCNQEECQHMIEKMESLLALVKIEFEDP